MEPTRLLTRTGDFVVEVLVPPFNPPAEIIQWGGRYFIRQPDGKYCEGMVWFSADPMAGRPGHTGVEYS